MNKRFFYVLFFLSLNLFCCSQEKTEEGKILARINDYNLTLEEFQSQLAAEQELDRDFKLTNKAKKTFLEELIRKELLIQEAKRLKLDRKEKFIRAIERYWESTLIRDLMEMKGKEIQAYKAGGSNEKLSVEQKAIKKTGILKEWIDNLRKKAKIEINEDLL